MGAYFSEDGQRAYGQALALTDAAEAIVLHAGERYMELAERWDHAGQPFTREDDVRLFAALQQAGLSTAADLARVHFGLPDSLF